jgi:hypothetical protein
MNVDETTPEPRCIFCGATGREVEFHNEHIIPQNLGGSWELSDCVCRVCNNALGHEVDVQTWRVSDVVSAHEKLKIPYDPNSVFKNHCRAEARLGGREVPFKAEWTPSGIRLHPHPHPKADGRMVYPLRNYKAHLHKHLSRRPGYSRPLIDDLIVRIDDAPPGEQVDHPTQGQVFVKGNPEQITLTVKPLANEMGRLIAKIALEFLHVVSGRLLVARPAVAEPLRQYSGMGEEASP